MRDGHAFFRGDGGGLVGYPVERIFEEIGFIAYYFHWSHAEIMALEHRDRRRYCEEISKINRKLNDEPENPFDVFNKG
ncbi:DUF6760 family protein [Brevibacillus humidisoli]|uniref:DUF6760 family protein n=1 Tax=Brevibacillus humidisoli TaxID=2895522 RepID=UPI0030B9D594